MFGTTATPSPAATPISLTPQDGQIESSSFSADGKYLYYGTNATDIERRHLWRVPLAGGAPEQLTRGDGIEHDPLRAAVGTDIAVAERRLQPAAVGGDLSRRRSDGARRVGAEGDLPDADEGVPDRRARRCREIVSLKAADGLEIHNQLFLPKDLRAGEKRPAIVFVHGGPMRQMLPGYHYMEVYHLFYGVNQWLASQGYVVLSVNYRSGIGYGKSFRTAPNTNQRGNSEYQDVLAGGKYLQSRPDVDPKRVGIWGLSYGGLLTAQALARNSDIFVAGVDLAGRASLRQQPRSREPRLQVVGDLGRSTTWKSPVLLIHGDDDRNVNFAQTVGLVQLLRAHNVPHELFVMPDDTHETLLYKRWLPMWERMEAFLNKHLKKEDATSTSHSRSETSRRRQHEGHEDTKTTKTLWSWCLGAFGALAVGACSSGGPAFSVAPNPDRNILLVTIDTLRADALGLVRRARGDAESRSARLPRRALRLRARARRRHARPRTRAS